jgi:hypothetical protein
MIWIGLVNRNGNLIYLPITFLGEMREPTVRIAGFLAHLRTPYLTNTNHKCKLFYHSFVINERADRRIMKQKLIWERNKHVNMTKYSSLPSEIMKAE